MTTYKPEIICDWDLHSNLEFSTKIQILVDTFSYDVIPENTIRIIIFQEPTSVPGITELKNTIMNRNNDKYYTYIFTYDQDILDSNTKSVFFLGINTWIIDYDFPDKEFSVSTVVGGKDQHYLEGYKIRHSLWNRQDEIKTAKKFYLSSHYAYNEGDYENCLVLNDDKRIMFNTQFHIAIENISIKNMFTEKLIDCLQTKTIPIYYGCSNIGAFFDINGFFIAHSTNDIIDICNSLTPDVYESKKQAIEYNYSKSMEYITHTKSLDKKLLEIMK